MGRVTTVSYECDWCKREPSDGEGSFDEMPGSWFWLDETHEMLCPDCNTERNDALARAKAIRRARETGASVEVESPHKSNEP